jgi:phosphoglycolate phosphatase-like HAD superfamily hydrolase
VPERLVLWDVDGTLLRAGGVAGRLYTDAIERVVGRPPVLEGVSMSGKTDPQIGLELLATLGLDVREGQAHLPLVLRHLEDGLAAAVDVLRERGTVLPGVRDVLAGLAEAGVAQTVLTGNTVANAATKLAAFDLDAALDLEVGAYGSDDADRLRLVPVALQRQHRRRGWAVRPEQVWVVGDTANDLACARAGGVRCLLVATGTTPIEELAALEPDAVRPDLSDVDEVVALLRH